MRKWIIFNWNWAETIFFCFVFVVVLLAVVDSWRGVEFLHMCACDSICGFFRFGITNCSIRISILYYMTFGWNFLILFVECCYSASMCNYYRPNRSDPQWLIHRYCIIELESLQKWLLSIKLTANLLLYTRLCIKICNPVTDCLKLAILEYCTCMLCHCARKSVTQTSCQQQQHNETIFDS